MADETTDSSNREQVVICFRWVDNSLSAHEEFIVLMRNLPFTILLRDYGHFINLAASDSMETSRIVKDALETTHEITRHIKYSPKRNAKLKQIRKSSEGQLQC